MLFVCSCKAVKNVNRQHKVQRISLLPLKLALDMVTDCVGGRRKQIWEDSLRNPIVNADLGFPARILLTSPVSYFPA